MSRRILFIIVGVIILVVITFVLIPKLLVTKNIRTRPMPPATKKSVKETKPEVTSKQPSLAHTDTAQVSVAPQVPSKIEVRPSKPETVFLWGRDPFVRDWTVQEAVSDLRLKAITISPNKAYALINDQILEEGEMIAGKKLIKIEKDHVILTQGERKIYLYLGQ
ncbi:MAG: hypothetical protein ABIK10_02870 [candidate division WOR-3 bacterium]